MFGVLKNTSLAIQLNMIKILPQGYVEHTLFNYLVRKGQISNHLLLLASKRINLKINPFYIIFANFHLSMITLAGVTMA